MLLLLRKIVILSDILNSGCAEKDIHMHFYTFPPCEESLTCNDVTLVSNDHPLMISPTTLTSRGPSVSSYVTSHQARIACNYSHRLSIPLSSLAQAVAWHTLSGFLADRKISSYTPSLVTLKCYRDIYVTWFTPYIVLKNDTLQIRDSWNLKQKKIWDSFAGSREK